MASPKTENQFRNNVRSPRFSTNRAVGFSGQPTPTPATADTPAIGTLSAQNIPRPSLASTLATNAGTTLLGEGLKAGAKSIFGKSSPSVGPANDPGTNPGGLDGPLGDAPIDPGVNPGGLDGPLGDAPVGADPGVNPGGLDGPLADLSPAADVAPVAGEIGADAGLATAGEAAGSAIADAAAAEGGFEVADLVALAACFITEAVMSQQGKDDQSEELQVLRAFRDNVMMQSVEGQAMVAEYEKIAPIIVQAIDQREDAFNVYQQIYSEFIAPAVESVKAGDYKGALEIYARMVSFAASYSEEVMQDDQEALAQIEEFGEQAAATAHDDSTTGEIAGQGMGDTDWAQNDQFQTGDQQPDTAMPAEDQFGAQDEQDLTGGQPPDMPAIGQMGVRRYQ